MVQAITDMLQMSYPPLFKLYVRPYRVRNYKCGIIHDDSPVSGPKNAHATFHDSFGRFLSGVVADDAESSLGRGIFRV